MTTNPTDPNSVRMTGENSFIRMSAEQGGPLTTRVSHWRVLLSPAGPGHVLYLKSDLVDDEVLVYSDNIALARWLQEEIESMLFPEFADQSIPVIEAEFSRSARRPPSSRANASAAMNSSTAPILRRHHSSSRQ